MTTTAAKHLLAALGARFHWGFRRPPAPGSARVDRVWQLVGGTITADPAALVSAVLPAREVQTLDGVRRWQCAGSCVAEAIRENNTWRLFFSHE